MAIFTCKKMTLTFHKFFDQEKHHMTMASTGHLTNVITTLGKLFSTSKRIF